MYARRKSSSSFCRLVSIHSPSSGRHPKRRRGEKQVFRFQALRRPARGLPGAARVSALAAATRGAGWPPRARLRVRDAVDKLARMRLTPARRLALALLAAVLAASAGRSDEGAPERVIRYERDLLTVRLTSVPVTDVLDELGRQAGAQIRGQVRDLRAVSVEFEAVPLADALHRLLGDQNFALVYGHEGRLKSVRLLGGPQTAAAPAAAPPASPPPGPPDLMDVFAKHPPIPVAGHLSEALGGQSATLLQLFDLSVHHADASVRAEAARIFIGTIDTDPALRASVVAQLNALNDVTLGALFRNLAGDHAQ